MRAAVVPNEKNRIRREQVNMEREKRIRKKKVDSFAVCYRKTSSLSRTRLTLSLMVFMCNATHQLSRTDVTAYTVLFCHKYYHHYYYYMLYSIHPPTHVIVACFLCTRVYEWHLPSLPPLILRYCCHLLLKRFPPSR